MIKASRSGADIQFSVPLLQPMSCGAGFGIFVENVHYRRAEKGRHLVDDGRGVPDSVDRLPAEGSSFADEALLINSLSNRELMTLELLVRGMNNKEIESYLRLSNKTISTYKTRLLEKLNVFSLVHLFEVAKRYGLAD